MTISEMVPGASGYTTPWAMSVDWDKNCYLNPTYDLHPAPKGTADMKIKREDDGSYTVCLGPNINREWTLCICRGYWKDIVVGKVVAR